MGEEKSSRIVERNAHMMTIRGIDTFPSCLNPCVSLVDFIVKPCPESCKLPFMLTVRCSTKTEISEPSARAFANYILKQCDIVKKRKGE